MANPALTSLNQSSFLDNIEGFNVGEFTSVAGIGGAYRLSRFPGHLDANYLMPGGKLAARQSTGCELRLVPEGDMLVFRLSAPDGAKVHAYQGEFWLEACTLKAGMVHEFHVTMGERLKALPPELSIAQHFSPHLLRLVVERGEVHLHGIDAFGAAFRPPRVSETPAKRWLAYGSSITQSDLYGYTFQAAERLGVDVLNKGMSGSCAIEAETVQFLADACEWDFMTCEWGVNVRSHLEPATFAQRVDNALDILCVTGKPLFLLTIFPNGCRFDVTEPKHRQREEAYDEILRETVTKRANPQLQLIEGHRIMRSASWLNGDLVHPSHLGQSRMGECLADILRTRLSAPIHPVKTDRA